jgi:hypothetical protein
MGVITKQEIAYRISCGAIKIEDQVGRIVNKSYKKLHEDDSIYYLTNAFNRYPYVIILGQNDKIMLCSPNNLLQFLELNNQGQKETNVH